MTEPVPAIAIRAAAAENDCRIEIESEILLAHERPDPLRGQGWTTRLDLQDRQVEMPQQRLVQAAHAPASPRAGA